MLVAQIGRKADEQQLEPLYFHVNGRLAQLLGGESVSNRFVAINELVKNAYDADAARAKIRFENVQAGSPAITVNDNGQGDDSV